MQILGTQAISDPVPLMVLTSEECDAVDGAFGPPGAAFGGAMGGLSYGIGVAFGTNNFTWGGLATAIGGGAVLGAISGPMSATQMVWTSNATMAGGVAHSISVM